MSRRSLAAALAVVVVVAVAVAAALLSNLGGGDRHASASSDPTDPTSSTSPMNAEGSPSPSAQPSDRLVPATSRFPAAGVCGRTTSAVLTVKIEPDTPDPRCASVSDSQWLRVVNRTGDYGLHAHTVTVAWIPGHSFTLHPGESKTFPRHFGAYLARGVHDLTAGSGYRAEIWLH
jgi:hypothetical protein